MVDRSTKPLLWSDNFAVGHAGLDAQHRRLVELINDVDAAIHSKNNPAQLADLLKALRDAAKEHIRQEDALLWEIRSGTYESAQDRSRTPHFLKVMAEAAFDMHMADHATLVARFDAIVGAPADVLCDTLKAWFLDHAIKHDSHLKAIFQAIQ